MNTKLFFLLQIKRIVKNKLFLSLLILFPLCLYCLSVSFRNKEDTRIQVGFAITVEDPLTEALGAKLLTLEDSLFSFRQFDTEEALIKEVQNNGIECGYLFRKPLKEELDKSHLKNLIRVYVSENTTCKGVVNELIYANMFEEYSLQLLKASLQEAGHLPFTSEAAMEFSLPPVSEELMEELYRTHLTDGSTFRFDLQFTDFGSTVGEGTSVASLALLRGLAGLFLLLCGFMALLTTHGDTRNGLYVKVLGIKRYLFPHITMLSYLLPAAVICLIGLGVCGLLGNLGTELIALFCYLVALLLFYTVLGSLIRNHTILCAAFPMILFCTIIFTPVIVDLSAFFPWLKVVRYVLPTSYYMLFF